MNASVWQPVQTALSPFLQQSYIQAHVTILVASCAFGMMIIRTGLKLRTDESRKRLRTVLAWFILFSRLVRYPIDAALGAFHWDDLFSLHVFFLCFLVIGTYLRINSAVYFSYFYRACKFFHFYL